MAVIWGIPYLLIKVSVGQLTPPSLVFIRTAIGALVLVPIALARGGLRPLLPHWRIVVLYTAVEIGVPWLLLSDAERKLSSSLAGLLVATVPLIGALLARVSGAADRMRPRQVAGLVLGLLGVGALVGLDLSASSLGAAGEMAIVCVCYAVGPVIIARRLAGIDSVLVVAASLALTAIAYAPVGVVQRPATMPSPSVIAAIGALGIVCTAVAFVLFFALIAEAGPVRATLITYFNPAVALLLGVLLLHEPFTVGAGVGLVLILGGSFLATRRQAAPAAPTAARVAVAQAEEPAATVASP